MSKKRNPADYVIGDEVEASDIDLDHEEVYLNGERFTEARASEMAAELERTSRERTANLIPGGKSLSGDGTHSPVVQARVSVSVRAKLDTIAERRGVRTSRLLREAIEQFIEREESRL
jgi:Ribbon-helix-helix domain